LVANPFCGSVPLGLPDDNPRAYHQWPGETFNVHYSGASVADFNRLPISRISAKQTFGWLIAAACRLSRHYTDPFR